jgi:hypothetical protein
LGNAKNVNLVKSVKNGRESCCEKGLFFAQTNNNALKEKHKSWKKFRSENNLWLQYYAEVTSERTNLSPFTKDYRGAAL